MFAGGGGATNPSGELDVSGVWVLAPMSARYSVCDVLGGVYCFLLMGAVCLLLAPAELLSN